MRFSSPGVPPSSGASGSLLSRPSMPLAVLLVKDAIEPVPPAGMRSGFYSSYFNEFEVQEFDCIFGCFCPLDWFAAIDLKDAYFHVSILLRHRPFLRFAFEGQTYQYKVLPFGLSLSPPKLWRRLLCGVRPQLPRRLADTCAVSRAIVRILRTGAQALRPVGSSGQLGKEQTRANAEDLFSQCGVGFGQPDSTPHPGTCSVGAELPQYFFRQDSVPTETFTEVPGAYGCSCGDSPARSAPYETASSLTQWPGPEVGVETR